MGQFSDSTLCNVDVCLDFDGVLYMYPSNTDCNLCPGVAVDGAMEALLRYRERYTVAVFSVRSAFPEGREAMKAFIASQTSPEFADSLEYPDHKPKARWYIDDKGIRYHGICFPDFKVLEDLFGLPWYKKGV